MPSHKVLDGVRYGVGPSDRSRNDSHAPTPRDRSIARNNAEYEDRRYDDIPASNRASQHNDRLPTDSGQYGRASRAGSRTRPTERYLEENDRIGQRPDRWEKLRDHVRNTRPSHQARDSQTPRVDRNNDRWEVVREFVRESRPSREQSGIRAGRNEGSRTRDSERTYTALDDDEYPRTPKYHRSPSRQASRSIDRANNHGTPTRGDSRTRAGDGNYRAQSRDNQYPPVVRRHSTIKRERFRPGDDETGDEYYRLNDDTSRRNDRDDKYYRGGDGEDSRYADRDAYRSERRNDRRSDYDEDAAYFNGASQR